MDFILNETDDGGMCPAFNGSVDLSYNERIVVIISYSLISVLAVGGNAIVIFIILYFRRMRSATNYFILNLAVAGKHDLKLVSVGFTCDQIAQSPHFYVSSKH